MRAAVVRERALAERLEEALRAAAAAAPPAAARAGAWGALAPASVSAALADLMREVEALRARVECGEQQQRAFNGVGGAPALAWAERGRAAEAEALRAAEAERQRAAAAEQQRAAAAAAAAAEAERQRAAEEERQRAAAAAAEAERQRQRATYCFNCKRNGHAKQQCPFNPYAKRARH